ncbi:MAG: HD domain-containing protein [Anaerolineaceae bacterium]|nr:HD domain-containing protein [Anaerolineaceae bacterium]
MNRWITDAIFKPQSAETVTPENRQKATLNYILWCAVVLILLVTCVRLYEWLRAPTKMNSFFLANTLFGILILAFAAHLNNKQKVKTAGSLFLIISFHLCLTAYPIRNPDQVLLYFALPTAAASFIIRSWSSILYSVICTAGFNVVYFAYFQGEPYPVFSLFCLLMISVITSLASKVVKQMSDQLVTAYDTTIEGWSQALEMRNRETEGHSHRVAELTMQLVKKLNIDESQWDHIRRGVLLHDIGKMGVPDNILCKPGPLTAAETAIMRNHPQYALKLLEPIPYLRPALDIPYCHHEKWNGTGYPRGLKGEDIPMAARIFSVIDVWDAMRSARSYRAEIPEPQVVEYLRSESGRSFDPRVIKAFFEMMGFPLYATEHSSFISRSRQIEKIES